MFGVGNDVFLVLHALCWSSMHCISPVLKPKFYIDIWGGGDALHTCFPAEYLGKPDEAICPGPSEHDIITLQSNVHIELRIHAVFRDIIENLTSTLCCSLQE